MRKGGPGAQRQRAEVTARAAEGGRRTPTVVAPASLPGVYHRFWFSYFRVTLHGAQRNVGFGPIRDIQGFMPPRGKVSGLER